MLSMTSRCLLLCLVLTFLTSCNFNYRDGERLFKEKKYEESKIKLLGVPADGRYYNEARLLIQKIDSTRSYKFRQDFIRDSIDIVKYEIKEDSIREVERLERIELLQSDIYAHIENLKNISEIENYTINQMIMKIGLFAVIATRCKAGLRIDIPELNRSAKQCQDLLLKVQLKEYPEMRSSYASVLTGQFTDYDIWVECEDSRNKTLVLVGDYFVFDERIPEIHELLKTKLKEFRFDHVSYRWSSKYPNGSRYSIDSKDDDWLGMP